MLQAGNQEVPDSLASSRVDSTSEGHKQMAVRAPHGANHQPAIHPRVFLEKAHDSLLMSLGQAAMASYALWTDNDLHRPCGMCRTPKAEDDDRSDDEGKAGDDVR